jgi:cation diffusion facilitator family transporter
VKQAPDDHAALRLAMNLSLATGLLMLVIKAGAYLWTGSSAILSDAAESVVHILAIFFAAWSLRVSDRPADDDHLYGHAKVSFFSAGFEGAMIIGAALFILYHAIHEWVTGISIEHLGLGTALTAVAAAINAVLGLYLLRTGKARHSLILEANGRHVLTDSWTSLGVLVGLGLVHLTGMLFWDPLFAIVVAVNILFSGVGLVRTSVGGLMDTADPETQAKLTELLTEQVRSHGIEFHDLRHRDVGNGHWVEVHLLFPDEMTIKEAHRIATEIERAIENRFETGAHVNTHLEAREDHDEVHA